MSDHIDDSTTDEDIEATVMRDRIREGDLAKDYSEQLYRLELRVQELEKRIDNVREILIYKKDSPARGKNFVECALDALEGKWPSK